MVHLLMTRETLIKLFKRHETIFILLFKFVIGIFIFTSINRIGFYDPTFHKFMKASIQFPLTLILSILFATLPLTFNLFIIIVSIAIQLSSSLVIMVAITLLLLCILFLYARLAPSESFLIIATIVCFLFKIPVLVPLIAGLYFGITAIIPICIGVFLWYLAPVVYKLLDMESYETLELLSLPDIAKDTYITFLNNFLENDAWIYTAIIFTIVLIFVFFTSKMSFNYVKEISLIFGAIINIFSFIICILVANINISILGVFFSTIFSFVIAYIISFFDIALDYNKASKVQFEDESYYYYVKAIPKINLTKNSTKKKLKKKVSQSKYTEDSKYSDKDDLDEGEYE